MKTLKLTTLLFVLAAYSQLTCAQSAKNFQWIGGPTYVLHLGSFKILTDPMFSPKSETAFIIPKHPTTGALNVPIQRYIAPAISIHCMLICY